jgi:nucleoside-diphosphate-sugar epimerase
MTQLAGEIIVLTGSKSGIKSMNLPSDDPKMREPDISRAKELLSWEPAVERELGLKKTIEYFRSVG